jgi:hypothetical protein
MRLAVAVLLVLTLPATAGPDALGCFRRIYDRAHLARHPDQVVTGVQLHIYRPPPKSRSSTGSTCSSGCAEKTRP